LLKLPYNSELVVLSRNGVHLHGTEGAIVVTSLRLLFVPGFIDVNKLVSELLGSKANGVGLAEVIDSFKVRGLGSAEVIEAALKNIDSDGSGTLDAKELKTFLSSELKHQQPAGGTTVMSFAHGGIASIAATAAAASSSGANERPLLLSFAIDALRVSVASFATKSASGKSFVSYQVEVTSLATAETWVVERRYREFLDLRTAIQALAPGALPPLPSKGFLQPVVLVQRRFGLDSFLAALLKVATARCQLFADFLGATAALQAAAEEEEEEDQEERLDAMSPDQRIAAAFLAQAQPREEARPGKQLVLLTKTGARFVFRVPDAETPAADWCAALADFHTTRSKDAFAVDPTHFPARSADWPTGEALMRAEYARVGAFAVGSKWRLFDNSDFAFAPSYPSVFAVRQLSWHHQKLNSLIFMNTPVPTMSGAKKRLGRNGDRVCRAAVKATGARTHLAAPQRHSALPKQSTSRRAEGSKRTQPKVPPPRCDPRHSARLHASHHGRTAETQRHSQRGGSKQKLRNVITFSWLT
jgi:hypothetical protein